MCRKIYTLTTQKIFYCGLNLVLIFHQEIQIEDKLFWELEMNILLVSMDKILFVKTTWHSCMKEKLMWQSFEQGIVVIMFSVPHFYLLMVNEV